MQKAQQQQAQRQQIREQRAAMMAQILSPEAQSRLGAIAAVKPDRAEALENIIIQNA